MLLEKIDIQIIVLRNIYTQDTYDEKFVKNLITNKGLYIRDLAFMYSVDKILKDIGCRYFYLLQWWILPNPLIWYADVGDELQELFDLYKPVLKQIKLAYTIWYSIMIGVQDLQ